MTEAVNKALKKVVDISNLISKRLADNDIEWIGP